MLPEWQQTQDRYYADPARHRHLAYNPQSVYAKDLVSRMVAGLDLRREHRVLELGAGAGRFTLHLARHCGQLTALDTSSGMLEALAKQAPPNNGIETLCASIEELPARYRGDPFDAVCGFFILHHLPDRVRLMEAIRAVVKPGGRIAFLEPNRWNPLFLLQVAACPEMSWRAERGMFSFSASATLRLLERSGFEEIGLERFGFFPPQILDRVRGALPVQRFLERLWPLDRFLPFVLITATRLAPAPHHAGAGPAR